MHGKSLLLRSGGLACIQQPMDLLHGVVDFHIEIPLAERRASPVIPLLILRSAR